MCSKRKVDDGKTGGGGIPKLQETKGRENQLSKRIKAGLIVVWSGFSLKLDKISARLIIDPHTRGGFKR